MRVLFLTKPYIIDPLGIGYLSACLKRAGHEVYLAHNNDIPGTLDAVGPDIVAFSVTTGQHVEYQDNAREVKEYAHGVWVVFGGPHPTYFPEQRDCVDYIVRGEAETSFVELVDAIETEEEAEEAGFPPTVVEPSPLIQDLDSIPMPDRALMYQFPANRDNGIRNVMTSRGCPFACVYCYNAVYRQLYKGQQVVRHHSVERVIAECLDVKDNHGARFIFFADDEFALSEERLAAIAEEYARQVALPYHAQLRIDLLTDSKARILAESGCRSVTFAIESGDEVYRRFVLGRRVTNDQILAGSELLHEHGIAFRIENMIGLPSEIIDDALATLDLNIACRPSLAWASLYQPYPGTALGDDCIREGLFTGSVDDFAPSFFEDSVLPLERKAAFINLQRVFGLAVRFPALRCVLGALLRMPPNPVYDWAHKWWKTQRYDRVLYATN